MQFGVQCLVVVQSRAVIDETQVADQVWPFNQQGDPLEGHLRTAGNSDIAPIGGAIRIAGRSKWQSTAISFLNLTELVVIDYVRPDERQQRFIDRQIHYLAQAGTVLFLQRD
ncbi:hypothetical protein D9M71_785570 [compost metagenome]